MPSRWRPRCTAPEIHWARRPLVLVLAALTLFAMSPRLPDDVDLRCDGDSAATR